MLALSAHDIYIAGDIYKKILERQSLIDNPYNGYEQVKDSVQVEYQKVHLHASKAAVELLIHNEINDLKAQLAALGIEFTVQPPRTVTLGGVAGVVRPNIFQVPQNAKDEG